MNESQTAPEYIDAELTLLEPGAGGRHRAIESGYCPNWWLPGPTDRVFASACVELLGDETIAPGAGGVVRIHPFAPELWRDVVIGSRLEMSEGPHQRIGEATVIQVVAAAMPAHQV